MAEKAKISLLQWLHGRMATLTEMTEISCPEGEID